jgi:hypothetical protein
MSPRGGDVRPAAELERPAADVEDAHALVVLLPEHRGDAARLRRVEVLDGRLHGALREDALVDERLDPLELLGRSPPSVGEVEAQAVGPDVAPLLRRVVAEDSLSALCRRCVAVWFFRVRSRRARSTLRAHGGSGLRLPVDFPRWTTTSPIFFAVLDR